MKILTKKCIVCGNEYAKPYTTSKKVWTKRKFCSLICIHKGKPSWNKGGKRYWESSGDFKKGHTPWNKGMGKPKSLIDKRKLGHPQAFATKEKIRKANLGSKSHLWKGGLTKKHYRIRRSAKYKNWRLAVFIRDNFTCQLCEAKKVYLNADHIKPFAKFPRLRFKLTNGRTLCVPCHKQTDTFAKHLNK